MSMAEHHVRRLLSGLGLAGRPIDAETLQEWGRALGRYDDADAGIIVERILRTQTHAYGMPPVGVVWEAAEHLGILRRMETASRAPLVGDTPTDCADCGGRGLVFLLVSENGGVQYHRAYRCHCPAADNIGWKNVKRLEKPEVE